MHLQYYNICNTYLLRFILNICCPYNTRYEMKAAMQALRNDVKQKRVDVNSLNSKVFQNAYMQLPPLDVMVRTSGEKRLSDFMLWQCVDGNCRIHFVDSLWPEFERVDFENIITQ